MSTKTANPEVQTFLGGIHETTHIVDAQGKVLGTYSPLSAEQADLLDRASKLFDAGEVRRRFEAEQGKGHSFEEVLQHLMSLERQE